jgi:mono/diheme cytochrome c family protein
MATRFVVVVGLAAALAACATESRNGVPAPGPTVAVERGAALATRDCGGCHALGLVGDSPRSMARPFRDMDLRYNAISFERRMAEMAGRGHHEMPPVRLTTSEIRDIAAFIESLDDR